MMIYVQSGASLCGFRPRVTRGKRNHDTDRAGGERLGLDGRRQADEHAGENNSLCEPFHGQDLLRKSDEIQVTIKGYDYG
jgi:hypothetical protein